MRIHAIPTDVLDTARSLDDEHHEHLPEAPGSPLRCCLERSGDDEPVVLFRYSPAAGKGPYEEIGPVFAHATPCGGPPRTDVLPAALCATPRVLRAYTPDGRIHDGVVALPDDAAFEKLFTDPEVAEIQVRSASHGCFLFAVTRD